MSDLILNENIIINIITIINNIVRYVWCIGRGLCTATPYKERRKLVRNKIS